MQRNNITKTNKQSQLAREKRIADDLFKRNTHLIQRQGSIEFVVPEENHLNRMLFHNMATGNVSPEGKLLKDGVPGKIRFYFIPKNKYNEIEKLFKKFSIPEDLRADLFGVYINMFFAHCTANYTGNSFEQFDKSINEICDVFSFFKTILNNDSKLIDLTFQYEDKTADIKKKGQEKFKLKSKRYSSKLAVGFIEDVIKTYQQQEIYEVLNKMCLPNIKEEKLNHFSGHKNMAKHLQSYYSTTIFDYLRNRLYNSGLDFYGTSEFEREIKKLKNKYPRNKLYEFIGKLMQISELLPVKGDNLDNNIIDIIKKKLSLKLQSEKKQLQAINEHNANSKDGTIQITPFHLLF